MFFFSIYIKGVDTEEQLAEMMPASFESAVKVTYVDDSPEVTPATEVPGDVMNTSLKQRLALELPLGKKAWVGVRVILNVIAQGIVRQKDANVSKQIWNAIVVVITGDVVPIKIKHIIQLV